MKNQFKCFMLLVLAFITSSWLLPATAHPTATGKTCHVVCIDQVAPLAVAHQLAIVGGDVLYVPPCYGTAGATKVKASGFDSAMLPEFYKELRIYSWYVPVMIGKPLTKSPGSLAWQSKLMLRSDHDKL